MYHQVLIKCDGLGETSRGARESVRLGDSAGVVGGVVVIVAT